MPFFKRYSDRVFVTPAWADAGEGWVAQDGEMQLSVRSRSGRIVILLRLLQGEFSLADEQQLQPAFVAKGKLVKGYEYAVLVPDLAHEFCAIAQLYRDRGAAENTFDELNTLPAETF